MRPIGGERRAWLLAAGVVSIILPCWLFPFGGCGADEARIGDWIAFFPEGDSLAPVRGLERSEEAYEVRAKDGTLLGWVFRTDRVDPEVKGFGGQLGVLVAVSAERRIIGLRLVEHKDTPCAVEKIKGGFFGQFRGRQPTGGWEEIDTVTGATLSSGAIARDVFLSSRRLFSAIDSVN